MDFELTPLPLPNIETWETRKVLKHCAEAHRHLAELKGMAASIPNEAILINTLALQEAKDSSEIENIITTHDDLYKQELAIESYTSAAAKEVRNYVAALKHGFAQVRKTKLIRLDDIIQIQEIIESNRAGLRKLPGTALKNQSTGDIIYTPPQDPEEILTLMNNLTAYINDESLCDADPLVKMAIIHHQFESIHPFYDGNGRTGRILNILYLVAQNLLDLPVLYLSRYITRNKGPYYAELQNARVSGQWEPWLIYMLQGISDTAQHTAGLINDIKKLMKSYKRMIRTEQPKMYRQELLNNLFNHPYTKIEFVMEDLQVSRITATKYLDNLVAMGLLKKEKLGRMNYYINQSLFELFTR
ncbi:MAG: Fic family protein [Ketobacteraceae bacterium]|nr:Fic family protein [Ketobacteraceae bacterium]